MIDKMKCIAWYILLPLGLLSSCKSTAVSSKQASAQDVHVTVGKPTSPDMPQQVSNRVLPSPKPERSVTLIIQYDRAIGDAGLLKAVRLFPAKLVHRYRIIPGMAIVVGESQVSQAKSYFKRIRGVLSVEQSQEAQLH